LKKNIIPLVFLLTFLLAGYTYIDYNCINLPTANLNYAQISFPDDVMNNLDEMDNMPETNPTTDAGATLGRILFYDVELSKNRTISCASCHQQQFAFTDSARFSKGFNGQLTDRNSMGLIHARFQKDTSFFWDNRASSLEAQVLMPIQSQIEMGLTLDTLIARVTKKTYYPPLFTAAFGTPEINSERISKAMAQFIRSMNSFGSKYREGVNTVKGNPSIVQFPNFTDQENLGKKLFMDENRGNCQACHTRNVMVPQGSKNIGLDLEYKDNGVGAAFKNSSKNGQFSVPSLINVALTAPYMHDGRYKTLEQVVNFYSDSIKPHPNLDGFLREIIPGTVDPNNNPCNSCPPRKLKYTQEEKAALVAFLNTLTDSSIIKDQRWSNPFCLKNNIQQPIPILSFNAFPNPIQTNTQLNISLIAPENAKVILKFISSNGAIIDTQNFTVQAGSNAFRMILPKVSTGIYLLQLEIPGSISISKKIMVH
jgi:cytochrome c peroxidase